MDIDHDLEHENANASVLILAVSPCQNRCCMQGDHTERLQLLAKWLEDQSAVEQGAPKYKSADFSIRWDTRKLNAELFLQAVCQNRLPSTTVCRHERDIPTQHGSVDCGVFVIEYAKHLVRQQPMTFTQEDMPSIRNKLHRALLSLQAHVGETPAFCCTGIAV